MTSKTFRVKIQNILRKTGLLPLAEKARYYEKLLSLKAANRAFVEYVREHLLRRFRIEDHVPSGFPFMEQDYWIARKTKVV
jgi:hypothetical protein